MAFIYYIVDYSITLTSPLLVLWLSDNGLTSQSSSIISDITVSCNVKELWINGNHTIGEDEQLYSILTNPSTMLETLDMDSTALSSRAAIALFTALKDNNSLKDAQHCPQ